MNQTLREIEAQRRAEFEAKKNDRSNLQQTEKLNAEIQELTLKNTQERLKSQQQYKDELNKMREEAIQANIQGKINDRELQRRLEGLTFECYKRDQFMAVEKKKTGSIQKKQIGDLEERKHKEKIDMVAPPEVFYTDKELSELRDQAEARNQELKAYSSTFAQAQQNQHLSKLQSAQEERNAKIAEEEAHLARLRQIQEQDNAFKRRSKQERNQEMNSTLTNLQKQKEAAWNSKKTDKTNKLQTEKLQNEISQLTKASIEDQHKQKSQYNHELSSLTASRQQQLNYEAEQSRIEEAKAKGLTFECYTRDPAMKEAIKETGTFQNKQIVEEASRKQNEKQNMIAPPPSLITTQQLTEMQKEANLQEMKRRAGLKEVMTTQYKETQAEKAARIAAERRNDALEAARLAELNNQVTKLEKEHHEAVKNDYSHYLSNQQTEAEIRRKEELEASRYDPHTQRIAEENARIGEIVKKCGKCDCILAHERTILKTNGDTHDN